MTPKRLPLNGLRLLPDGSLTRDEVRVLCDVIEAQDATLAAVRDFATPLQIDHRLGDHTQFSRGWEAAKVRVLAILDGTAEQ